MFHPADRRFLGLFVSELLALGRGETLTPLPVSLPHHQVCPACGFDRWDGRDEHPWGGRRFARRCPGPPRASSRQARAAGPAGAISPLIDELKGYAQGSEVRVPDAVDGDEAVDPHHFRLLG